MLLKIHHFHLSELGELSGPQMAAMMKPGIRVVRGPDWKKGYGSQVENKLCL